jgi:hypothetical protein
VELPSVFFFEFASAGCESSLLSGGKSDSLDLKSACHARTIIFLSWVSLLLAAVAASALMPDIIR